MNAADERRTRGIFVRTTRRKYFGALLAGHGVKTWRRRPSLPISALGGYSYLSRIEIVVWPI